MSHSIFVAGSSNTDMVIQAPRLPQAGETILGGSFLMNPGGKGANQAVAAARLGGRVIFCCKLGDDMFGQKARKQFIQEGIDTRHVLLDPYHPSGVALITVGAKGENVIVVAPGANSQLSVEDAEKAISNLDASVDVVLLQLEIPLATVAYIIKRCSAMGKTIILNPAPAQPIPDELYPLLDYITPNETEAEILTGIPVHQPSDAANASSLLRKKGAKQVVITLGEQGAFVCGDDVEEWIPVQPVHAVDTTAAGDVFNGALATAIAAKKPLRAAVRFATTAATISVTRMGAQASAPYLREMEEQMSD